MATFKTLSNYRGFMSYMGIWVLVWISFKLIIVTCLKIYFSVRFMYDGLQLDFSQQLVDQRPIDVIVHKLTDHINRSLGHGQEALKWIEMVQVCVFDYYHTFSFVL